MNVFLLPTDKPSRLIKNNHSQLLLTIQTLPLDREICCFPQNIYITSAEEIKDGEYGLSRLGEIIKFHSGYDYRYYAKIILTTDQDLIKDGVQAIDDDFLKWFVKNPSCEKVEVIGELDEVDPQIYVDYSYNYKIIIPKEEPKFEDSIENSLSIMSIANDMFGKKEKPKLTNTINKDELGIPKGSLTELIGVNKQETLEEAYLNKLIDEANKEFTLDRKLAKEVAIKFAKWQQEQDKNKYSEEEVRNIANWAFGFYRRNDLSDSELEDEFDKVLTELFKKK
jgi:hypothetical protein